MCIVLGEKGDGFSGQGDYYEFVRDPVLLTEKHCLDIHKLLD